VVYRFVVGQFSDENGITVGVWFSCAHVSTRTKYTYKHVVQLYTDDIGEGKSQPLAFGVYHRSFRFEDSIL
jgi:hypothetical protein